MKPLRDLKSDWKASADFPQSYLIFPSLLQLNIREGIFTHSTKIQLISKTPYVFFKGTNLMEKMN